MACTCYRFGFTIACTCYSLILPGLTIAAHLVLQWLVLAMAWFYYDLYLLWLSFITTFTTSQIADLIKCHLVVE